MTLQAHIPRMNTVANAVIPRAEFRVFGHGIIEIVQKHMWTCSAILHSARQMPHEVYFLSRRSAEASITGTSITGADTAGTNITGTNFDGVNIKVREGLLDIKIKIGETPEGYEIFQPHGKFTFPISHTDLNDALSHLKIHIPPLTPTSDPQPVTTYTLEECLALARNHPDMTTVTVEKQRHRFTVENVICEYARVCFNGAFMETACCESENIAALRKVTQALGIADMPNTNYIMAARRVAGLDIADGVVFWQKT